MFAARYFDGASARLHRVELVQDGQGGFVLRGDGVERAFAAADVTLSAPLGRAPRTLQFGDGAQLQIDESDARLDAWFPSADRVQRWADRGERRWRWVLAAAVLVGVSMVALFTHGVPMLADAAARRVPASAERLLARQVMAVLDRTAFDPSALPPARREALQARFATLVAGLPRAADFELLHRASPAIGPNAFALPGGVVVVTDELIALAGHDEEILAVLAHEAAHHEHRHALRAAMQETAVVLLVGFIAGDASSLGSLAAALPTVLLQSGYSRGFESEADAFAFALLRERGISPARFADFMQRLDKDGSASTAQDYLSTHPASAARIAAARRAAE